MRARGNVAAPPAEPEVEVLSDIAADPSVRVLGDPADSDLGPAVARIRREYAAQATKRKDHVSAGLFALFLGPFGMHKFYLGYNKAAFLMLAVSVIGGIFTFGLAAAVVWIVAIIEGIMYLTKSQTDFDRQYVLGSREWF